MLSRNSKRFSIRSPASRCPCCGNPPNSACLPSSVPEKFGGMEMDLTSAMIVAEGVGQRRLVLGHGTALMPASERCLFCSSALRSRRQKYLPKLATAEMVGAYCLSEPHAGSDAMALKTRADLSADGTHYVLNGQKMWITNGGCGRSVHVFAKIGGEKLTAFLVERVFGGVTSGAEEKKMGIKGSSTTAIYFDNVQVPVENVLGEIGRGHIIAFNILNLGRLKIGPVRSGRCARKCSRRRLNTRSNGTRSARSIAEFGMIQHKLAEMAIRIYAAESMSYRVAGLIRWSRFAVTGHDSAEDSAAVRSSRSSARIVKVFASEMLDYVVDEGVQIHGGYGYHQDYHVERAYRDSRINRIFEGTNEINRLLATGMLLKRAQRGQLPLVEAVKKLQAEILAGPAPADLVANAKKIVLLLLGAAYQRYLTDIEEQQEVMAGIADAAILTFAMESVQLRTQKSGGIEMVDVFLCDSMQSIEGIAKTVLAACAEGDSLRTQLAVLRRFAKYEPVDSIAARRRIAARYL